MINWKILAVALLVTLAATLAFACGSDDDAGGDGGDEPAATEVMEDDGQEPDGGEAPSSGGSGSATLTIGDESWTFDGVFCAFSPEEAQNAANSFFLSAFGESAEGVRIQLDASILDFEEQGRYEGDGVTHSVSVDDVEDFENPSVAWSAIIGLTGGAPDLIQVDGKNVTASGVFDDDRTDEFEETPGTLEATCP